MVVGLRVSRAAPRQAAQSFTKSLRCGLSVTTCPQPEPLIVVQEELPIAGDPVPHEHKWQRRVKRPEALVVDRRRLIARVVRPEQDSVLHIRWNPELPLDLAEDALGTDQPASR